MCDIYMGDTLIGKKVDYCDMMRSCEVDDTYGTLGYINYGLTENSAFRNIPSGTVFKIDCTDYSETGCNKGAATGLSMYTFFNQLEGEWVYYVQIALALAQGLAESALYFAYPHECLYAATDAIGFANNLWTNINFLEYSYDKPSKVAYYLQTGMSAAMLLFNSYRCWQFDDWISDKVPTQEDRDWF
jgi:hypothetical protein